MDFIFEPVSFVLGLLLAGLVGLWAFLARGKRAEDEALLLAQFKALAQDTLAQSQESLLTLATERIRTLHAEAAHEADKRHLDFKALVEPIKKNLNDLDQRIVTLDKTGAGLNEHLHLMAQSQRKLQDETAQLVQALRAPNVRGRWGELQLQRALEAAGFVQGTHFDMQVTRKTRDGADIRPDFVVYLPEARELIIDAKTPIDAYLDALREGIGQREQNEALQRHAKSLRDHVMSLGKKAYWENFKGMDFVVLFVPGEGVLSAALSMDPSLMEDAARARVMLASPLSILGLLRVVSYGWQQQKLAEEAHRIAEIGGQLHERLAGFIDHVVKLGNQINTVNKTYDDAVGSLQTRVLPAARKMEALGVASKNALPDEIKLVEKKTRVIAANE